MRARLCGVISLVCAIAAQAEVHPDLLIVPTTEVPHAVAVRYAWANAPTGNLFNKAGFPASPFRTDSPATRR